MGFLKRMTGIKSQRKNSLTVTKTGRNNVKSLEISYFNFVRYINVLTKCWPLEGFYGVFSQWKYRVLVDNPKYFWSWWRSFVNVFFFCQDMTSSAPKFQEQINSKSALWLCSSLLCKRSLSILCMFIDLEVRSIWKVISSTRRAQVIKFRLQRRLMLS